MRIPFTEQCLNNRLLQEGVSSLMLWTEGPKDLRPLEAASVDLMRALVTC